MMRVGWFRQVHVKSSESQHLRVLLSNRRFFKRKFIDVEKEVRGTLKAFGIKVGKVSRGQFEVRALEVVEAALPLRQDLVRGMLAVRRSRVPCDLPDSIAGPRGTRFGIRRQPG